MTEVQTPARQGQRVDHGQSRMTPALARKNRAYRVIEPMRQFRAGAAYGESIGRTATIAAMPSTVNRVLQALVEAGQRSADFVVVEDIARGANLDHDSVRRDLRVLSSYGDLFFRSVLEPDRRTVVYVNHVTAYARRVAETGLPLEADGLAPSPVPTHRRRLVGRVVKVIGAVLGAAAARTIANLVADAVHRP